MNPAHPSSTDAAPTHLHGRWLIVVCSVWLVLTSTAVFLFLFSLPMYDAPLQIVCSGLPRCSFYGQLTRGTLPWLEQAHLSVSAYAAIFLALVSLNGLLVLLFGGGILWRLWGKDNALVGLLTSFVLILGGTIATKSGSLATFSPATPLVLTIVGSLAFSLSWPAFAVVVLIFPTGRFAPPWTWLTVRLGLIQLLVDALPWPSTPRDAQPRCASRGPCRRSDPYEAALCADC